MQKKKKEKRFDSNIFELTWEIWQEFKIGDKNK